MTAEAPPLDIRQDDLRGPEITHLLRGHLDSAIANSPAGAAHALDLDALRHPSVTVWSAWLGKQLAGCGALRALSDTHGELTAEQRQRLLELADRCPVHRTLENEIRVETELG